ncbi:hypothetical protein D3C72_1901100 [compost metagenome]
MMRQFELGGLILSSLVSNLLHFGILSSAMSLQIDADLYLSLAKRLVKMVLATSVMAGFLYGWTYLSQELPVSLGLFVGIALGAGIYLGISQLLRVKELTGVLETLKEKKK